MAYNETTQKTEIPWTQGVDKLTQNIFQFMQLKGQLDSKKKEQEENQRAEGLKMLQAFNEMGQKNDTPEFWKAVIAPGISKASKMLGINLPLDQYEPHPKDKTFLKQYTATVDSAIKMQKPELINELAPQMFERWQSETTPAERKGKEMSAYKEIEGLVSQGKKTFAESMGGEYKRLGALPQTDQAYSTPEAKKGIQDYNKQVMMPMIESADASVAKGIKDESAGKLTETEVMGDSIPPPLRKGVDPKQSYKVMRDAEGNIVKVVGQSLGTSRYNPYTQGPSPDVVFNRRTGKYTYSDTGAPAVAGDVKEKAGNYAWYKQPGTQRLIRRTESIVAPGGAVDEAIRFATLVDNPSGTPINRLTGAAKVAFGNSQRQLLGLVNNVSAEEQQQIFGAQGGGERFLDLAQSLSDTNLSVEQYVNAAKEIKYLIYTRQVANVRGTPEEQKWADMGKKFKEDRPFTAATGSAEDKLKSNARNGDKKAQTFLKSQGVAW